MLHDDVSQNAPDKPRSNPPHKVLPDGLAAKDSSADCLIALNHSRASSATSLDAAFASQAAFSRPTTRSVQQLLEASRHYGVSGVQPIGNEGTSDATLANKVRRHTLAGANASATTLAADLSRRTNTPRLSRPTVSSHSSVSVAPVSALSHPDSPAQGAHAANPGNLKHAPELPLPLQIDSQIPSSHYLLSAGDTAFTHTPSTPIQIPLKQSVSLVAPLTARFRDGLPLVQDPLLESPTERQQRLLLLPYYDRNRPASKTASFVSSPTLSTRSSFSDLPAGTLSPLRPLARSKSDDPCGRKDHWHCPSSPSRFYLRPQRTKRRHKTNRLSTSSKRNSEHMRVPSRGSSIGLTPSSPLSPGSPRSRTATMDQNRNPNARSRRPQQEFALSIPRFHPAMYQSPSASTVSTAASTPNSLRMPTGHPPPNSPRSRQSAEARRALLEMRNEILRATGASDAGPLKQKLPGTPSLVPTMSPSEATPLTLEDAPGDYLTAGAARRGQNVDASSQRDLVERMIREEEERRKGNQSVPSSAPVSPAAGP